MNTNAFAKGDALAKLIELIGADNKAFKAQDAELMASINEVREMFNTDEFTSCTLEDFYNLYDTGKIEAGHKYCITSAIPSDNIANTLYASFKNIVIIGAPGGKCFGLAIASTGVALVKGWAEHDAKVTYFATVEMLAKVATAYGHSNTVDTLANIPVNATTVVANISTDQTLSWAPNLWMGLEVVCLINNIGTEDVNIILPDNCNEAVLTIPAGEYSEISVINVDGTYYTRVPSTTPASGGTGESPVYEEITAADVQAMFAGTYGS